MENRLTWIKGCILHHFVFICVDKYFAFIATTKMKNENVKCLAVKYLKKRLTVKYLKKLFQEKGLTENVWGKSSSPSVSNEETRRKTFQTNSLFGEKSKWEWKLKVKMRVREEIINLILENNQCTQDESESYNEWNRKVNMSKYKVEVELHTNCSFGKNLFLCREFVILCQ